MALDDKIKGQLSQYLELLENPVVLKVSLGEDTKSKEMDDFIQTIASLSTKVSVEKATLKRTPSFSVNRPNEDMGIVFAGTPLGHELTSFVLALLQVGGRAPKVDQASIDRIKKITRKLSFETYISLTCHNCPDVVQALNIMSLLNPNISHEMVDGAVFKEEVESKKIFAVPMIYLNGEPFGSGRLTLDDILDLLGEGEDADAFNEKAPFDVLVIGGGPAGASAAIYAARKGIRTGIVAERFGGQILDTATIENFISVKSTEGPQLARSLEEHVNEYNVDVMKAQKVKSVTKTDDLFHVELENGAVLRSKTVIVATGARWRNINVPGEEKFKTKGVAYCPHCDAPLFAGKHVAVIGGGNSGIEAAIDLAGVVKQVTVLEFLPELKADEVLQKRLLSLPNVTVIKNAATKEIHGDETVNGLTYIDRATDEEKHIELEGVFVQIGLVPNTDFLGDQVEKNRIGEIVVDKVGATKIPGLFAAGDCTDSPYNQVIISMGSGATAALGAFDYLIRN